MFTRNVCFHAAKQTHLQSVYMMSWKIFKKH